MIIILSFLLKTVFLIAHNYDILYNVIFIKFPFGIMIPLKFNFHNNYTGCYYKLNFCFQVVRKNLLLYLVIDKKWTNLQDLNTSHAGQRVLLRARLHTSRGTGNNKT